MSLRYRYSSRKLDELHKRPEPLDGIALPTIRNLEESAIIGENFGAVLTSGPEDWEVRFGHPNHRVWSFGDTTSRRSGPQLFQVEEMVFWGADQQDLLVHCHAGMSRSTATAWGVAIARGADPKASLQALLDAHPMDYDGEKRWFCPNLLLVEHLQVIFNDPTLVDIRREVLKHDNRVSHWL